MIYINEFLPNPVGPDAQGEFVELYNADAATISLAGWKLGTGTRATSTGSVAPAKTKPFPFSGRTIPPHGYLVLRHAETGLSLKNTDGALLLYGPDGKVADIAAFSGSAPEGKSFSRVEYARGPAEHFAFVDPTPGSANAPFDVRVHAMRHVAGAPLGPRPSIAAPFFSALGLAAAIAITIFYAIKKNENLSHLLFGGDEKPR